MVTDLDEPTPVEREPTRGRRGGRCGLVLLLVLIIAVAFVPPIVRTGIRMAKGIADAVVQTLSGIAISVNTGVTDVFAALEASDAVRERLGEPLAFPPISDVTWKSEPVARPDELDLEFAISGPRGKARVEATLRTTEQGQEIKTLTVTPVDGGPAVNVIEQPSVSRCSPAALSTTSGGGGSTSATAPRAIVGESTT